MSIVKERVCAECESMEILYVDCRCVWDKKYPTMELEFEVCDCCGRMDSKPIDNEYNAAQREAMFGKREEDPDE